MDATRPRATRQAVIVSPGSDPQPVHVPDAAPASFATASRPIGVVLLSILQFLTGGAFVVYGIVLLVAAAIGGAVVDAFNLPSWIQSIIGLVAAVGAILCFGFATFVLLLATSTLRGRPWAWTANLVLSILFTITAAIGFFGSFSDSAAVVTMLLYLGFQVLILWYLYTPDVKAFFKKSQMRAPWQRAKPAPQ